MTEELHEDTGKTLSIPLRDEWEKQCVFYTAGFGEVKKQEVPPSSSSSHSPHDSDSEQLVEDEHTILKKYSIKKVKAIKKDKPDVVVTKRKKNYKKIKDNKEDTYEVATVFHKPNGKLGVRKIVFSAGKLSEDEHREFKKTYGKLLILEDTFQKEVFDKCGGFLNPRFWKFNFTYYLGELDPRDLTNRLSYHISDLQ